MARDMLVPWLQRAANQRVSIPTQGWGGKYFDNFFKALRQRTGLQTMFLNVVNTMQNVTGLSSGLVWLLLYAKRHLAVHSPT